MELKDWSVMIAIFCTSGIYWWLLDLWYKKDPDSYDANTWFLVVIGVGYVLLWLLVIIPPEVWLKIFSGFLSACVLIILRSLLMNARRNIRLRRQLEQGKRDEA